MTRLGRVVVVAERDGDATVLSRLDSSGLSAARATPWGLFLVSAGASPLGGDELSTEISLRKGSKLVVRSVGATLARRGPIEGSTSLSSVRARVEDGARLTFLPEPGIACCGACHRSTASIELAASARLCWRDEVVLGRIGEEAGTWWSDRSISVAGTPLLVSELGLGPGSRSWLAPSVADSARAVSSLVLVCAALEKAAAKTAENEGAVGGCFPLPGPGVEILAIGQSLEACRALVTGLAAPFRAAPANRCDLATS